LKLLLDTHTFIWWDSDPSKLSSLVHASIQDPTNTVYLSAASVWKMVIKRQLGKLTLRVPLKALISQQQSNGIQILSVALPHVLAVDSLPQVHKDPFDRILIAQAIVEGATLASNDELLSKYPAPVIW
jgi:PIN domain nuclease of toxin-antitoxin system